MKKILHPHPPSSLSLSFNYFSPPSLSRAFFIYLFILKFVYHLISLSLVKLPLSTINIFSLSLSLSAPFFSIHSAQICLLYSYMPRFYSFYFTLLQSSLLFALRSVCSVLPDPSPLFSYLIYPIMLLSAYSALYCLPISDRLGLAQFGLARSVLICIFLF